MEKMDGRCAEASFFQKSSKRNSAFGTELVKDREAVNDGADICERGGGSGGQVLLRQKFVV